MISMLKSIKWKSDLLQMFWRSMASIQIKQGVIFNIHLIALLKLGVLDKKWDKDCKMYSVINSAVKNIPQKNNKRQYNWIFCSNPSSSNIVWTIQSYLKKLKNQIENTMTIFPQIIYRHSLTPPVGSGYKIRQPTVPLVVVSNNELCCCQVTIGDITSMLTTQRDTDVPETLLEFEAP